MTGATAELAIRARRAAFNAAIAARDAGAIGPILARDCVMVTGSDSAVVSGRLAQVKLWRREFAVPAPVTYVRTPESIAVSPVEPVAMEQGVWQGLDGEDRVFASGSYAAKWRETSEGWLIEAELFVTLG